MKNKLQQYIFDNQLFTKEEKLLVAVSGGMDSMVLCHLLWLLGYDFAIAHCNFQLRGEESDGDEKFVHEMATKMGVRFHKKRFDTQGMSKTQKIGIQEAARQLRYVWFEEIRQKFDYQWIITAHHASDNVETVLFNFAKGTGIRGLHGILPKNGFIVRPLLWAKRANILTFSTTENIEFREDSSNFSDKYARNYIRQHIIPEFKRVNPDFENTVSANIERFREIEILMDYFIQQIKTEIVQTIDNQIFINKNALILYPSVSTVLFEILKEYNFNNDQVKQILDDSWGRTKTGTKFYSATHELLIDRLFCIVKPFEKASDTEGVSFLIENGADIFNLKNIQLSFNCFTLKPFSIFKKKNIAQLDYDKLTFPLKLRHWHTGDTYQPFGMNGKSQKLSDFFNHNKISSFEKEQIWILETAKNEICWIVNWRIDERFKLSDETRCCLNIEYYPTL